MKISLTTYFIIFSILGSSFNSSSQTWSYDFGVMTPGWNEFSSNIEVHEDSIYIFSSDMNSEGETRLVASNISLSGELNWNKIYSFENTSLNSGAANSTDVSTDNSLYVLAGQYESWEDGDENDFDFGHLVVFDEYLDTLFTRIIGDTINYYTSAQARITDDNGFIIVGNTTVGYGENGINSYLIKFDSEGQLQWETIHSYFPNYFNTEYNIVELNNGNFVTGGSLRELINTPNRPILNLYDSDGNHLDFLLFGNDEYNEGWAKINKLEDGNIIMCATKLDAFQDPKFYLAKISPELEIIWEQEYDANGSAATLNQIKENADGTFISVGVFIDEIIGQEFGRIMKFESDGSLIWDRSYQHANEGFAQFNVLYDVIEIEENEGYVACGYRSDVFTGQNYWVIKVDEMGCLIPGCDTIASTLEIDHPDNIEFLIGPNPCQNFTGIFLHGNNQVNHSNLQMDIFDAMGRLIKSIESIRLDTNYILDTSGFANGTYIVHLINDNNILGIKKLVVNHW